MRPLLLLLLTLATPLSAADWSELREVVQSEMTEKKMPGVAVAVIAEGQVVFAEGFGLADVAKKRPVTLETRFRIGSVAKMLTAAAILSRETKLGEPIGTYLPELPPNVGTLTIEQLLSHRGGVGDRIPDMPIEEDIIFTGPDRIFSYSSLGFSLAARAAAAAQGVTFEQLLQQSIFDKLAMKSTGYSENLSLDATGYRNGKRTAYLKHEHLRPAGFLYSNVSDLSRFALAFLRGELPRELSVVRSDVPGDPRRYGYGTMLQDENGSLAVFHAGDEPGGSAFLKMIPAKNCAVIVTSNATGRLPRTMATALRLAAGHEPPAEIREEPASLTTSDVADLTGHYQNWSRLRIRTRGNTAVLGPDLPWFLSWLPLKRQLVKYAPDRFGIVGTTVGPEPLRFTAVRDNDGKIEYLFIQGRAFKRRA